MKTMPRTLLSALAILLCSCSGGGDSGPKTTLKIDSPKEADIQLELDHLAGVLRQKNMLITNLAQAEIVSIEHNRRSPVAVLTIRTVPPLNPMADPPQTKLVLRMTEAGWQIYDRDLEDGASSTFLTFSNR